MNRKDRRAQTKILQKTAKISRADAKKLVEMKYSHYPLEEGTKVKLNAGKRSGKIIIQYSTNDELERILNLIR